MLLGIQSDSVSEASEIAATVSVINHLYGCLKIMSILNLHIEQKAFTLEIMDIKSTSD